MNANRSNPAATWILLISMFLLAVPAHAQRKTGPIAAPPPVSSPEKTPPDRGKPAPQAAASTEAPLVNLDVLVTDEDGLVLAGLKQDNFRVFDNGKAQTITHFEGVGAPITIVMLMEYSASAYNYFAYKAASWSSSFLNYLEPKDYIALVTYDIKPTVRVDFTRKRAEVQEALSTLSYPHFREASLYDAIVDTLDRLDRVKGKKAILLIGTGSNTMSHNSLGDVYTRIRESDVTIFSVGVAEAEYLAAESQFRGRPSIRYLQSKNALERFARLSGGMAWFPRFRGAIPDIFHSVATFLRSQYRIGFSPPRPERDGKYHKLKVAIIGPDGKTLVAINPKGKRRKVEVHVREGYTAPRADARR